MEVKEMDYNPERDPGKKARADRTFSGRSEPLYDAFDSWIDEWRSVSNVGSLALSSPDSDDQTAMFHDAVDHITGYEIDAPDWDEMLAPYRDEPDALDIAGYFISAVANEQDDRVTRFSAETDTPVSGLGYHLAREKTLILDCNAQYPGRLASGTLVNDGKVDRFAGGKGLLYINRGTTGTLPHMGIYALVNTGAVSDESWINGATSVINLGSIQRLKSKQIPPAHILNSDDEWDPDPTIINAGTLEEELGSMDKFVASIDDEMQDALDDLEQAMQSDDIDTVHDGIGTWDGQYPRWKLDE